jgi:hypothetical protein
VWFVLVFSGTGFSIVGVGDFNFNIHWMISFCGGVSAWGLLVWFIFVLSGKGFSIAGVGGFNFNIHCMMSVLLGYLLGWVLFGVFLFCLASK